ncbi:unnamed protein product [Closterium sp. NIES-54]
MRVDEPFLLRHLPVPPPSSPPTSLPTPPPTSLPTPPPTSVLDLFFFATCSAGEGCFIPAPYFPAFDNDMSIRNELSVACARLAAFWKKKVAERAADGQGGNGQEENGPGVAGQAENGQGGVAEGNGKSEEGEEKQGEGGEKGQGAVGGEGSLSRKRKAEDDPGDA